MNEQFYYKLLNIGKKDQDIEKILLESIKEVIEEIKPTNKELSRVCKVIANNLSLSLKTKKIEHRIINLSNYNLYEHIVIMCRTMTNDKIKYYLIDPSFIQFKGNKFYDTLKERSLTTFNDLLELGYTKIDEETFHKYLQSFGYNGREIELNDIFLELKNKHKN